MYISTIDMLKRIFALDYNHEDPIRSFHNSEAIVYIRTYKKHDIIITQKDPVNYFYFLLSGKAAVMNSIAYSKGNLIDTLLPLDIMGLIEYLNDIPYYTGYVVAETSCTVLRIPVTQYGSIIRQDSALCFETLRVLGRVTQSNMDRAETSSIFHPKDRLGHFLYLSSQNHSRYVCPLTRKELASQLFINLRTLYRYLSALEDEGYLILNHGKIVIESKQFEKLEERYGSTIL